MTGPDARYLKRASCGPPAEGLEGDAMALSECPVLRSVSICYACARLGETGA